MLLQCTREWTITEFKIWVKILPLRSELERSPPKRKVGCSNPSRDRPKSLKQVVTAPLPNTHHLMWVSRVLRDDHHKQIPRVTVSVARYRTLTAQLPWVPSKGQNLHPIIGKGGVSIWVKNSQVRRKTTNKIHTNKKLCTSEYDKYMELSIE